MRTVINRLILGIVFVMSVFALSSCNTLSGFGKDNSPKPQALNDFKPRQAFKQQWVTKVGASGHTQAIRLEIARISNVLYTGSGDGTVSAVDSDTGKLLWQVTVDDHLMSGPGVSEQLVVVSTSSAKLVALDRNSGHILWQENLPNQTMAAPAVTRHVVLVRTIDGQLIALSAENGVKKWSFTNPSPPLVLRGGSRPAVSGGVVVVGFANAQIYAFNVETGRLLWQQLLAIPQNDGSAKGLVDIVDDIEIKQGVAYVAGYQGNLAAIDVSSGNVLWKRAVSSYTGLNVTANTVFISDTDSNVWALDRQTGRVDWKQSQLQYRDITGPADVGNSIVVGDEQGYLDAMSQDSGEQVARIDIVGGGVYTNPIGIGDRVFAVADDGNLYAFKLGAIAQQS